MKRDEQIARIADNSTIWDVIVVGGGATGLGIAVDAATRGYKVALLEQHDFAKSTSSRSTKLVHGGVRYLAQGDIKLVTEALRERALMKQNAPHLVKDARFIIGNYKWWEKPYYTIGLTMYDLLAGKQGLGRSLPMSKSSTIKEIPGIKVQGLCGGVVYHDGQFDDARMAISLAQTAVKNGALVINYAKVAGLTKDRNGKISGVTLCDMLTDNQYQLQGKAVINATGIFVDDLMQMDAPGKDKIVRPSQGVHLVVDSTFMGNASSSLMIPKTSDGRVLFCVPWHDKVVIGTTDTPVKEFVLEPRALEEEIDFILKTAGEYLTKQPTRKDVLSIFAGLRPLAAPKNNADEAKTKEISRSHKIVISDTGLITITGGKWTTYREMAEDVLNKAETLIGLGHKTCVTRNLRLHGYKENVDRTHFNHVYGSDIDNIRVIEERHPEFGEKIHPNYDYTPSQVIWAVRAEMAFTLEDVLARRLRLLFLDARVAIDVAPKIAAIMAKELAKDQHWQEEQINDFVNLAQGYLLEPYQPVYS